MRLRLMAKGRLVKVQTDKKLKKRRNGNLLAYVSQGGRDYGKRMLTLGYARVDTSGRRFSRYRAYKRAQVKARTDRRGSWGTCGNL